MVGGRPVLVDTYPDFRIPVDKIAAAITSRTKAILLNSPANPTGAVASEADVRAIAELAAERKIALVSDEIYQLFCYDGPLPSPARFNPDTIVIDGLSKTYGITGWRVGFVHGPAAIIDTMVKLQQYTFVCAPHPLQWASAVALDVDMSAQVAAYRRRRDMLVDGLSDLYEIERPGGAFYLFPRAPWGTGTEFVAKAIENSLLIIPGGIFSRQDTHFRISYAADESIIHRGIEVLRKIAKRS
jgi:aspartate aminotransferase/aminotransferase